MGELLHTLYPQPDPYGALSMPVYSTAAFEFASAEDMEAAFQGRKKQYTYSRISNPTVEHLEERVRQLSEAKHVAALATGMAAITQVFMAIAYPGANIVTSTRLFGNTFSFFQSTLAAFGVEVRFCDLLNLEQVASRIDSHTCALFCEAVTNPHLEVPNLEALAQLGKQHGVPLIADTTLMPWCAFKARHAGVAVEVVSSTKYISGGGTGLGGLILDHGTFDWSGSPRLQGMQHIAPQDRLNAKLRSEILRNLGASMAPQVAYMQSLGLETMQLRFEKASDNARQLAEWLLQQPEVIQVGYIGLPQHPSYATSRRQFGPWSGSLLTFTLKDRATCYAFMNSLKLVKRATNLFDNRTLIIHPLSTIYGTLSPEAQRLVAVPDGLLRLSVGLEDIEALKADIQQALA